MTIRLFGRDEWDFSHHVTTTRRSYLQYENAILKQELLSREHR